MIETVYIHEARFRGHQDYKAVTGLCFVGWKGLERIGMDGDCKDSCHVVEWHTALLVAESRDVSVQRTRQQPSL